MTRRLVPIAAVVLLLLASAAKADNSFYRVLAAKPNAELTDAVRGFYELIAGRDAGATTFDQQAAVLIERKVMPAAWLKSPKAKFTRGRAAYMICGACHIKGGVTMRVFGLSERYAFRECVFLGIWERGTQHDLLTGGELLGLLKWAADYNEARAPKTPEQAPTETTSPEPAPAPEPEAKTETKTEPEPTIPATTYIVREGDTFAKISEQFYGTAERDQLIMKANNIKDPWSLKPGQTLVIPPEPSD
jgi:LysM repeat protein